MRQILTHLLSVAMVCAFHTVAAQPSFPSWGLEHLAGSTLSRGSAGVTLPASQQLIEMDEPVSVGRGKMLLRWRLREIRDSGFIRLERSNQQSGPFEVVSMVRVNGNARAGEFTDDQPMRGVNHYRLVYVSVTGAQYLSKVGATGLLGEMACRFYPNPVDNMLIIRAEQPLEMYLSDATGRNRIVMKLKAGLQTIDVSSLEKGLYIITLLQPETGKSTTEKLMKN